MRNKNRIIFTILPLVLTFSSCSQSENDSLASSNSDFSQNTSNDSSASSPKEEVLPLELNAKNIISSLSEIVTSNNFTIKTHFVGYVPMSCVSYAEKYIYYSEYDAGYLTLKSFDSEYTSSTELVYQYQINDGKVDLLYPLTSGGIFTVAKPYTSLASFNYMLNLDVSSLKESEFKLENGYLVTANKNLVSCLASMCGYESEAQDGTFYKAKLKYDKNNNLSYILQMFDDSYSLVDVSSTNTTICDVNKTHKKEVEDYLASNYEMNNEPLTLSQASSLIFADENDVISLNNHSEIQIQNGDGGIAAKEEINRSANYFEHTKIDVLTDRRLTSLAKNNPNGKPCYVGLNANNELEEDEFSDYDTWENTYPSCSDFIKKQLKAFRKVEDNHYRYYGWERSSFFKSVSFLNGRNNIKWIDLYLTSNVVSKIEFTYFTSSDTYEDGTKFYYDTKIICEVVPDREIKEPTPYSNKSESALLTKVLSKFDGTSKFQISATNARSEYFKLITTFDLNHYTVEKRYFTGAGQRSFVNGYLKVGDNETRRFLLDREGVLKANGPTINKEISSYININISPNIFVKTNENEYMFDSYVLRTVRNNMTLGINGRYMLPSTFKMTIDPEKEEIVSASYDYDDGMFNNGTEILSFKYGDEVELKEGLEEKLSSLNDWKEPTTWKEESADVYKYLVKYFGDEADNVPYLYDPNVYGLWDVSDSTLELEISSNVDSGDPASFFSKYAKLLLDSGFETTTLTSMPGATIYVKGNVSIRLAKVFVGGIYLWKTGDAK